MSLTLRRRRAEVLVPLAWLGQMKAQMEHAAERAGPMAEEAREMAATRLTDARSWAAPRLDRAAHTVEEDLAPRISAFLSDAARRVEPAPVRSRRWPVVVLLCGIALGAAGYAMYRKNAQQWTDSMKDTASDASQWMGDKAERMGETVSEKADTAGKQAGEQADDISKKLS